MPHEMRPIELARLHYGQRAAHGKSEADAARPEKRIKPTNAPAKQRWVYIVLALAFGFYGVHNFYAGRYAVGFLQLAVLLVGAVLLLQFGWIGLAILGGELAWVLVELGVRQDAWGRTMV